MSDAQLRSFVEIARSKSINKAAANLYMAPSALRKQLDSLEREVGASLVVRGKTGAELTDGGKTFLDCAQLILETFARGCLEAREAQLACGKLIYLLGTSGQITGSGFYDALASFSAGHPSVRVEVAQSHENLGTIPPDYLLGPRDQKFAVAEKTVLRTVPLSCNLPRDHRLASTGTVRLQDLAGERVIYLPERPLADELPGNLAAELARLGAEVRHHGTGNDKSRCVMELIAGSHVGISVGPYTMLPESYRSVPLEWPGYPLTLWRTRGASPESQVLMEFFAAHYGGVIEPVG